MKRKIGFVSILTSLLILTSCGQKPLREDIKEFIKSFSLDASVQAYKVAGSTQEELKIEAGVRTKTITEINFDVSDAASPQYHRNIKTYVDASLNKEVDEYIEKVEDKFYFHRGEEVKEYTLLECHNLVQDFFYKQVEAEGTYHLRGFYYGDYILQSCQSFQDYVTIDQENELYIFEAEQVKPADKGENVNVHQKYEVNKLGMLVNNVVSMISPSLEYYITIDVYNDVSTI